MDIGPLRNPGGVEKPDGRPQRTDKRTAESVPAAARDEAAISESGRETAASVDALAQRARNGDESERRTRIDRALQKLMNGDLDDPAVHAEVAKRLLEARFLS